MSGVRNLVQERRRIIHHDENILYIHSGTQARQGIKYEVKTGITGDQNGGKGRKRNQTSDTTVVRLRR